MKNLAQMVGTGVIALTMLVAADSYAQVKIGIIDTRTVLSGLPEFTEAQQKVEGMKKTWEDSLNMIKVQFQAKSEGYAKIADTMSPEAKKKANEELTSMEANFNKFRDSKLGQDGELMQAQTSMLKPVFDKITNAISGFAKKEKLTVVLEKSSTLYMDPSYDMTEKFAAYVKGTK